MPTVVDSLVIKLGLDTVQFSQQQQRAITGLNQTMTTLKKTEETGRRTAMQMSSQGNVAAEYFSKIKNEALGLMSVLIGGKGLESIVRNSVNSLSALGRAATNIGVSIPDLDAFRKAIEANGGSAEAATASFQALSDSMSALLAKGDLTGLAARNTIGANQGDNALQTYQKFVQFASQNRANVGLIRTVGKDLGLDEGSINTALRGAVQFEKDLADARRRSAVTPEMVARMTALQSSWIKLSQTAGSLADVFVDALGPAMQAVLDIANKFAVNVLPHVKDFVRENPKLSAGLAVGGVAAGGLLSWIGGRMILGRLLGGLLGRGVGGVVAGAAGGAGLVGAAAALTGAASALTAAAAALGGGGVAKAAGDALGAVGGSGGRAGRLATSAPRAGILGRLGRTALRWGGPAAIAAGLVLDSTSTQTDEHERTEGMRGGAGAPQPPLPQDTAAKASAIRDKLAADLGISKDQAAAIVGNLQAESGLRGINEKNPLVPGSRGGFGWAQWTGPRRVAFEKYARERGLDPASDEANYGFLLQELKGPGYRRMMNQLRGTTDIGQATALVERDYEGPAVSNAAARTRIARQIAMANGARGQQLAMNDNFGGGVQTVHVNGPITVNTQATDAPGVARGLRGAFANQANTGLA